MISKNRSSPTLGELLNHKTPLFWSKQRQVLHNFGSKISLGGGLFSFLEQKSASKALETCYFAYFSGQWGRLEPPLPPSPLATLQVDCRQQLYTNLQYIFCLFVNSEQTHYFKIGKFCLFMISRPKLNVKWLVTQTGGQSGLQLFSF